MWTSCHWYELSHLFKAADMVFMFVYVGRGCSKRKGQFDSRGAYHSKKSRTPSQKSQKKILKISRKSQNLIKFKIVKILKIKKNLKNF